MKITDSVYHIGVNDRKIDLFEGQYIVPNGMAYNSYIIMDEKTAVLDTVDAHFGDEWLKNIKDVLGDKQPDYLVIHHMEPDHSACILKFIEKYPETKLVVNTKILKMIKQFFDIDVTDKAVIVENGGTLSLGEHELTFVFAPMVHWPEVMMSYDKKDKILFSADAFGKFGTLDTDEDWACEARRYYFGIVGKYGVQVQAVLKKLAGLDVSKICSLHGPVLSENLEYYINLYDTWSSYKPEKEGVVIAYTSVYGNTKKAVELLAETLKEKGVKVVLTDLARSDWAENVEDAFKYDKMVLATTTYNAGIFPYMREFIEHLTEREYKNRTVAFIENGTWAPMAAKIMKQMLEGCKNVNYCENTVTINSAMNQESRAQILALADELTK